MRIRQQFLVAASNETENIQEHLICAATLLVQKSDILYRMAQFQQAEHLCSQAADIFKNTNNHAKYAGTLTKLAIIFEQRGNLQKGITLCEQALAIAESIKNHLVIAQVHQNLSSIYYRARNWDSAPKSAQKAYDY